MDHVPPARGCCDDLARSWRPTRRDLFQFGGVNLLSAGLLRMLNGSTAQGAAIGRRARAKACIVLFQVGGPYQCDTFDPKPAAPEEVRGPFKPIRTPIPGLHVTEALPLLARQSARRTGSADIRRSGRSTSATWRRQSFTHWASILGGRCATSRASLTTCATAIR